MIKVKYTRNKWYVYAKGYRIGFYDEEQARQYAALLEIQNTLMTV